MTVQDVEAMVRELRDRELIKELTHQYAHRVRQNDPEGVAHLFAEDGEFEMNPTTVIRGRADLQKFYESVLPQMGGSPYDFLSNHVIHMGGDRATGVCSVEFLGVHEGKSLRGAGHYDDEYVKVGDEWKFQRRQISIYFIAGHGEDWAREKFTINIRP